MIKIEKKKQLQKQEEELLLKFELIKSDFKELLTKINKD